jgi:polysaccharide export outer membrane protein
VGPMKVSGCTIQQIGSMIRTRLKGKSQDPQVVVTVHQNVANTIVVMGSVKKPGRLPLTLAQDHVLDAIAESGGVNDANQDTLIRVTRGSHVTETFLDRLHADTASNFILAPNDRIEAIYQPRTFSVFGATGKVSEIPFTTPDVSLAAALARAGGPSEQQADPSAVFVFRYEELQGVPPNRNSKPIAYRLDLMNPSSYFLAQRFRMHPNDVIYIANAGANLPTKMIQILNLFFQPFYTAKVIGQ